MKIAILDDYQGAAFHYADWSGLSARAEVAVFTDHVSASEAVIARLLPFDVVVLMRERTPLPRAILEHLPNLRFIASTGARNASIDATAARERGIEIARTGNRADPTIEFTWALILASARNIVPESNAIRAGLWQQGVGYGLRGRTLGILGLGRIGSEVARIALAFGMEVIAWSQNLTAEVAAAAGARLVTKDTLFAHADILTVHLVLSERTRDLVGAAEISSMKSSARLINTSRGPIVNEEGLIAALYGGTIAGAAIDVFDQEPLPADHPFRSCPNLLATPHLGYVTDGMYRVFYEDAVSNITSWLDRNEPPRTMA